MSKTPSISCSSLMPHSSQFILITGGCGYIGSHITALLKENNYSIIVIDNLSTGSEQNKIPGVIYEIGDIGDVVFLKKIFSTYPIQTIIHLAAKISVPESDEKPFFYYEENLAKSLLLMKIGIEHHIQHFIFSSTAAVYGESDADLISEKSFINPSNVYGRSKYFAEKALEDIAKKSNVSFFAFRYFNVAGINLSYGVGNWNRDASSLIQKIARNFAKNHYEVTIYGDDYPTKDGTGIRDYIHVMDIANAHLLLIKKLKGILQPMTDVLNIGYGQGISVLEIVQIFEKITRQKIKVTIAKKRMGDVSKSNADPAKIKKILGWNSLYQDPLNEIIFTELKWCEKLGTLVFPDPIS